jgi:K+-sensing histidine kinase KdpD
MNGMLATLLATYRNYGGAIKLNFENFSFTELLQECVTEMLYVAKDKGIIINNIYENNIFLCADRVQIKRVIMNLLSNGIKYAFKNSELKLITISKDNKLLFNFENNSPFISEEKQKAIFKQYVSYTGTNKELGIGLGLYASKKIIEAHNGNIFVKSYKEDKNIFGFEIPLIQNNDYIKEVCF